MPDLVGFGQIWLVGVFCPAVRVVVAPAWSRRGGFVGGVRASGGAVRGGVMLGGAPSESFAGLLSADGDGVRGRRFTSLEAPPCSPSLYTLRSGSSGESLWPGRVGRPESNKITYVVRKIGPSTCDQTKYYNLIAQRVNLQ